MYPAAPRTDLVDQLHGVRVADPYRRLEEAGDPETVAWVDAENALTRSLLEGPGRDALVSRLRRLHRYPRAWSAAVRGERVFLLENDGTHHQAMLCVAHAGAAALGDSRVLIDPNQLDATGTTAITAFEPNLDGTLVVYALSSSGSDRQELAIHNVDRGGDLADRIRWVKFASIAWTAHGFFYTRYPQPGTVAAEDLQYFCQVWFHRLGASQAADRLIYHRPDAPQVVFDVDVTSDAEHVVITSRRGSSDDAEARVARVEDVLSGKGGDLLRPLVTGFGAGWHFVGGRGGQLFFRTDDAAPLGRIVSFAATDAAPVAREIVAQSTDTIADAAIVDGRLLLSTLHNASSRLQTYSLDGVPLVEIRLPALGTVSGIGGEWTGARCCLTYTSFTIPPQILVCHLDEGRASAPDVASLPIDPDRYVTDQVWYPSKDGTRISMFLVRRRDADTGPRPVLLTGYGGFNISLTPAFDPSDILWLDEGGVIAVANLRGGGEYGDAWHRAGMLAHKQNVFDDFIAAAEWLRTSGIAAPGQIAIEGGSNGGLLVGACMTQRPELFGGVVCRVPVADMLRYHLFTVGRFWIPEYGSADDREQFAHLLRYSPYHNVAAGGWYPPTLIMTADTDDRVAPGMAKKFAARLQEAVAADGGPILLRVETRAGHGTGKPLGKQIDEQADIYAFLFKYVTRTSASEQQRH